MTVFCWPVAKAVVAHAARRVGHHAHHVIGRGVRHVAAHKIATGAAIVMTTVCINIPGIPPGEEFPVPPIPPAEGVWCCNTPWVPFGSAPPVSGFLPPGLEGAVFPPIVPGSWTPSSETPLPSRIFTPGERPSEIASIPEPRAWALLAAAIVLFFCARRWSAVRMKQWQQETDRMNRELEMVRQDYLKQLATITEERDRKPEPVPQKNPGDPNEFQFTPVYTEIYSPPVSPNTRVVVLKPSDCGTDTTSLTTSCAAGTP